MKTSVYEQIQEKISHVSEKAANAFKMQVAPNIGEEMYRLGFTSSISIVKDYENIDHDEALRARLMRYFGCKVMTRAEVRAFEKKYKLATHVASRFKDAIPHENQKDIVNFVERVKKEQLNHGRVETDLYHIPITTGFLITAPPDMFRKAQNFSEMTQSEYLKWLEDDPIVWKEIFRFNPNVKSGQVRGSNDQTEYLAMVTAWGMESFLLNTN